MRAGIPQPDLFAAQGSRERRPYVNALLPRMLAALDGRGWVGAATLCVELETDRRSLREAGNKSAGRIIGHQRGYCLTTQAALQDVAAVVARHLSQSREQKVRAMAIERVRHAACGDILGGVA